VARTKTLAAEITGFLVTVLSSSSSVY